MNIDHHYNVTINWTGNKGTGTTDYKSYERSHTIQIDGKDELLASSDAPFRGDVSKHNPEDMMVSAIASCHMLWYLHLCADAGIIVLEYSDKASGILTLPEHGSGHFSEITLRPNVIVQDISMIEKANELHEKAHEKCFIANSVNFPVYHKPTSVAMEQPEHFQ